MNSSDIMSDHTSNHFNSHSSTLSHNQVLNSIDHKIGSVIKDDPYLCHLPKDITVTELEDLIGYESGQKIAVSVQTHDSSYRVIVNSNANVGQLKQSVRKWFTYNYKRNKYKNKSNLNWKYIWNSYCLIFNDHKLTEDSITIESLGIVNKSIISFGRKTFNK